jgi:IS4 transposase
MLLGKHFEAFVQKSPASVMVRAVLERAFHSERLNALFERTAVLQYTRDLMFATVVRLMTEVVLGVSRSIRAAYQDAEETIPVSIASVYNKLNGIETQVSAELVRDSAAQLGPIVRRMRGAAPELLPGYRVRMLDGNHLSGTDHRLAALRTLRAGALPGQTLVVLDPSLGLAVDVVPCEDGHAQERSLLDDVLAMVKPGDLWIADRNFCTTKFFFGIADQGGFFAIRQHASTLVWELVGTRKRRGKTDTGRVYEQDVRLQNPATGETLMVRRVTVVLKEPTRDGETEIHILTNVPAKDANARVIATLYAKRWTIETMFQELTVALTCEINTLGYPKAALFGFCLALAAYNAVSLVKASLRAVHGSQTVDEQFSWYYLCIHLAKVYGGMMIAIPSRRWDVFREMEDVRFARVLKQLAANIDLAKFQKHPRGPKKPPPKKASGAKIKHVATSRILANTG